MLIQTWSLTNQIKFDLNFWALISYQVKLNVVDAYFWQRAQQWKKPNNIEKGGKEK